MPESQAINVRYDGVAARFKLPLLYVTSGALGTAAHFAVLFATIGITTPVLASTFGAIVGCAVNYYLARNVVFASARPIGHSLPRFMAVALIGLAINAAVIHTLVAVLPIVVSQLVASTTVLVVGFTTNSRWTFQ